MSKALDAGSAPSIVDEAELDRLIAGESADRQGSDILQELRQELSASEDQMRRMGEDLAAARYEQGRLDEERSRLGADLGSARIQIETLRRERDTLEEKIRDMIKVSEAEMTKIMDHTERMQHLRFTQDDVASLTRRVEDLQAQLAAEQAAGAKHLEDLRGTQAHRDILESKIAGMLEVMRRETQKIVDHTERQFATMVEGAEARQRLADEVARGDALEGRLRDLEHRQKELEHRERETVAAIHASMSWRLTKPVRFASRALARVGLRRGAR